MHWRDIQKNNFKKVKEVADFLHLNGEQVDQLLLTPSFPFNLPQRLARKMEKGSIADPLFRQFVPLKKENLLSQGFLADPVSDHSFQLTPKLLKKYQGRALLLTTSACAMHCRYCFRQNYSYEKEAGYQREIEAIKKDTSIKEIILSGGDPLSLSDAPLAVLLDQLFSIPHLKMVRFHTRFPLGIPERITPEFLKMIEGRAVTFVLHSNHPRELDEDVLTALRKIQKTGTLLLGQTVLLKGINDDLETLSALSWKFLEGGVLPYYLHQFDPIQGGMHFQTSTEIGKELILQMRKSLPGYAVPKYVQEIPFEAYKTPLELTCD